MWLSLVERCVRDAEAAGSTPVTSTTILNKKASGKLDIKSLILNYNLYLGGVLYLLAALINIYVLKFLDFISASFNIAYICFYNVNISLYFKRAYWQKENHRGLSCYYWCGNNFYILKYKGDSLNQTYCKLK